MDCLRLGTTVKWAVLLREVAVTGGSRVDVVWTFATVDFEVYKLVSVLLESIKLGQMINLSVIFHVVIHLSLSKNLILNPVSRATSTRFPESLISSRPGGREDERTWERSCHRVKRKKEICYFCFSLLFIGCKQSIKTLLHRITISLPTLLILPECWHINWLALLSTI